MNRRGLLRQVACGWAVVGALWACRPVPSNPEDDGYPTGGAIGSGGAANTGGLSTPGGAANTGGLTNTGGESDSGLDVPDPGNEPDPLDPDAACGIGTTEATLKPVSLLVMFDRSSSMIDNIADPKAGTTRWEMATSALQGFLSHPSTEGLGVALRFFPHDLPATGCASQVCDISACAQPLVALHTLRAETAPADAHELALLEALNAATPESVTKQGTPTGAALEGAVEWALAYQAEKPDERTAILIVTDGDPEGCEQRIFYLIQHLGRALDAGIKTYFIGIADANGEGLGRAPMDYLANAGGTDQAYYITDSPTAASDLLETLDAVRGAALGCDFALPKATFEGDVVDPALVNVAYLPGNGGEVNFTKVTQAEDCKDSQSWFYDDEAHPERLHLCPAACDLVSADAEARFRILVGCVSVLE